MIIDERKATVQLKPLKIDLLKLADVVKRLSRLDAEAVLGFMGVPLSALDSIEKFNAGKIERGYYVTSICSAILQDTMGRIVAEEKR
jgi:hypothetical protein